MLHPQGLMWNIYPIYFNYSAAFGLQKCFPFLTGFDDSFMAFIGVKKRLRPEILGWTKLETKEEWMNVVNDYFNPLSTDKLDSICFPLIKGATECHWAVYNGSVWVEQASHGGAINVWASSEELIDDVYKRGHFVPGSHFFF
jgi:hypothetical protein